MTSLGMLKIQRKPKMPRWDFEILPFTKLS